MRPDVPAVASTASRGEPAAVDGMLAAIQATVLGHGVGEGWPSASKPLATPPDDLEGRDPDYIREQLPLLWLISQLWFRAEVRGLAKIPAEGPVLLVGNHSGGVMIPDTLVLALAFSAYFGVERPFYQLTHSLALTLPGASWIRRFGAIPASEENADHALTKGAAVLVYPGGDYEVFRPSWESARVDFGGRMGFLRTAHRDRVPVVPVVAVGGQETALFLTRGEGLARLLRLDKLLRLKAVPLSLALPWGLTLGSVGYLPLPAKITVEVCDPIDVRAPWGERPDWETAYRDVIGTMQAALGRLAAERRFPILG